MKKLFRKDVELNIGKGFAYFEFDGEWATRQVEVYGDRWFNSKRITKGNLALTCRSATLTTGIEAQKKGYRK